MTTLLAAVVGLLAGLHAATWGMYKDAPHEGFSLRTFARSPALGLVLGIVVQPLTGLDPHRPAALVVLFGVVYVVERALAEIYKTFLRDEDQSKYFIPMQFHVGGRLVRSRTARRIVGAAYTAGLVGMVAGVARLEQSGLGAHALVTVLLIGSVGGWISALGGAWKDASSEGFQTLKFFRSPVLAALFAAGLSALTADLLLITLAATGYTVAATETYKTFVFPSQPRGKFAGMPVRYPDMLRRRRRFVPMYLAIWAGVLAAVIGATHG
jgi:hypothetical protein